MNRLAYSALAILLFVACGSARKTEDIPEAQTRRDPAELDALFESYLPFGVDFAERQTCFSELDACTEEEIDPSSVAYTNNSVSVSDLNGNHCLEVREKIIGEDGHLLTLVDKKFAAWRIGWQDIGDEDVNTADQDRLYAATITCANGNSRRLVRLQPDEDQADIETP